jgi:hypothetical protein
VGAEFGDRAEVGDGSKSELDRSFGVAEGAEHGLMSA